MFLKKISDFTSRIEFRLSLFYLGFVFLVFIITFLFFYHSAQFFLIQRDQDAIEAKIARIEEIIEKDGSSGLVNFFNNDKTKSSFKRYLTHVALNNEILVNQDPPEIENFDHTTVKNKINSQTSSGWFYIPSVSLDENALELRKVTHGDYTIVVGSSTDDRDDLMENFKEISLFIFIPLLFIVSLGTFFITNRSLRPLKNLYHTIETIQKGELSTRAQIPKNKDEIYHITLAFNAMIEQIQSLVHTITTTLDDVAHDLKTPIMRIRIGAEVALRSGSLEKLTEANVNSLETCDHLITLVNTLLLQSRFDSKAEKLNLQEFDALEIIKEVEDLYIFVAEEKNIQIHIIAQPIRVKAELIYFKQVVANLLDNAIKYSPENTEVILKLEEEKSLHQVVLTVQDFGIGISEHEQPKIWHRLYRSDNSRNEKGFGLGLSVVKTIVEAHGGHVELKSSLGKGSTFKVYFPS